CTHVKASSVPAARSSASSGISNVSTFASAKSLRVSMARPQCSEQSRRGLLEEKPGGSALAPQTRSMRKGNIVGAVEPECKTGAVARSDPAIIHPRGRGVCQRQFLDNPWRREAAARLATRMDGLRRSDRNYSRMNAGRTNPLHFGTNLRSTL